MKINVGGANVLIHYYSRIDNIFFSFFFYFFSFFPQTKGMSEAAKQQKKKKINSRLFLVCQYACARFLLLLLVLVIVVVIHQYYSAACKRANCSSCHQWYQTHPDTTKLNTKICYACRSVYLYKCKQYYYTDYTLYTECFGSKHELECIYRITIRY